MQSAGGFLDWFKSKPKRTTEAFTFENVQTWLTSLHDRGDITTQQRNNLLLHAYSNNWVNFYYFLQQYVFTDKIFALYPLLVKTHEFIYEDNKFKGAYSPSPRILRSASAGGGKKRKRSRSSSGRGKRKRQRTLSRRSKH